MNTPLVSVICLCYNHSLYVAEALFSVWAQTYANVELIVVDDASTDGSQAVIKSLLEDYPEVPFLSLEENRGNCYAFNRGLELAKGEWVIDLAADDVLLPHRIGVQMNLAQELAPDYGVLFSDAWLINHEGQQLSTYYRRNNTGSLIEEVPQGAVFPYLLRKAFICSPTMLIRHRLLEELNGYDESLSYEDYDLWVRSGKNWKYAFQEDILTKKRMLKSSLGQQFYQKRVNANLTSTLKIIHKALSLVETVEEKKALAVSIRYHLRQSLWMECFELVGAFKKALENVEKLRIEDHLWYYLAKWKMPLYRYYQWYQKKQ